MNDVVACLDFNNYFWSSQAEFEPSVIGKVGVVLGPNDGCVISRSPAAKKVGITMGAPLFKIRDLPEAQDAVIYSANFPLYGDLSDRAFEVLGIFSPEIERYSIDEAFFTLYPGRRGTLDRFLRNVHEKMFDYTGIPNTIGAGLTKVQAKLALEIGKHSDKAEGVVNLYNSKYYRAALERTPVENIWKIGPRSAIKLKEVGIHTAWDLHEADHYSIRRLLTVQGARVLMELRGKKCFPLETVECTKHSIGCNRTLGQTISDYRDVRNAMIHFLSLACARLRKNKLAAKKVTVFVGTDPFHPVPCKYRRDLTYKNHYHSTYQKEIQGWAIKCLDEIYREDFEYKKVGVVLSGLIPVENMTYRLFDDAVYVRWENLYRAVDAVNDKFGRGTIQLGNVRANGPWQTKQSRKSPNYTTRIEDVPVIH
jgi:DNA polymerase V